MFCSVLVVTFVKMCLLYCEIDVVKTVAINNTTIHKFIFFKSLTEDKLGKSKMYKILYDPFKFEARQQQKATT
jgi:hypothetical protein